MLFVFSGYSFLDQHINEIVFNCLRRNNRLSVIVFFYADAEVEKLRAISNGYLNLTVFGPTTGIVNGVYGKWIYEKEELRSKEGATYWDEAGSRLLLGDYCALVDFLVANSGRKREIEVTVNED